MKYTRTQLKSIVAKLLDSDDFDDTFIAVNFIRAVYVLFGHPDLISDTELDIMKTAYDDFERDGHLITD